jgi:nicotinamide-nucleotide amidase
MDPKEIEQTLERLSELLVARGWRLAAAESCTGGWVAKMCTDRAGSSVWFDRGFVTYSNGAKVDMLGVDRGVLERDGAVSEAVARQMAEGARRASGAEAALAVTGIAGPDGGTAAKPVGTVWFAWSCAGRPTVSEVRHFQGDRESVRWQSADHALRGLLRAAAG